MAEIQRSGARGTKNRALGNRDLWPLVKSLIGDANRRHKIHAKIAASGQIEVTKV